MKLLKSAGLREKIWLPVPETSDGIPGVWNTGRQNKREYMSEKR